MGWLPHSRIAVTGLWSGPSYRPLQTYLRRQLGWASKPLRVGDAELSRFCQPCGECKRMYKSLWYKVSKAT